MSMNNTPSGERIHIGFFGRRNAGKSSVVNAVTGQDLAVVSDVKGTTTDPVKKAMELLPLGPVVIIDTPGIDDEGTLGEMRVQKAREALNKTDIAVLVHDARESLTEAETALISLFKEKKTPFIIAHNKCDTLGVTPEGKESEIYVSALTGESIPVDKTVGDRVSAATVNQSGYLKCRATRVGEDTTLAQIIKMVSDAAATKAPIAKVADKVSGVFVPAVLAIALVTAGLLAMAFMGFSGVDKGLAALFGM